MGIIFSSGRKKTEKQPKTTKQIAAKLKEHAAELQNQRVRKRESQTRRNIEAMNQKLQHPRQNLVQQLRNKFGLSNSTLNRQENNNILILQEKARALNDQVQIADSTDKINKLKDVVHEQWLIHSSQNQNSYLNKDWKNILNIISKIEKIENQERIRYITQHTQLDERKEAITKLSEYLNKHFIHMVLDMFKLQIYIWMKNTSPITGTLVNEIKQEFVDLNNDDKFRQSMDLLLKKYSEKNYLSEASSKKKYLSEASLQSSLTKENKIIWYELDNFLELLFYNMKEKLFVLDTYKQLFLNNSKYVSMLRTSINTYIQNTIIKGEYVKLMMQLQNKEKEIINKYKREEAEKRRNEARRRHYNERLKNNAKKNVSAKKKVSAKEYSKQELKRLQEQNRLLTQQTKNYRRRARRFEKTYGIPLEQVFELPGFHGF